MSDQETISLTVAVAGLVLVAVSSIPAVCDLTKRLRLPSRTKRASSSINGTGRIGSNGGGEYAILKELYQDDDGYATEESSKKFSDRFHRIFISILSTTGFLLSLALGIIATVVSPGLPSSSLPSCPWLIERWLQFGIWVLLCLQSIVLVSESSPTRRFTLGLYNAISSIILVVVTCAVSAILQLQSSSAYVVSLVSIQIAVSACLGCVCTLLPRRPDVFRNGKPVDQQYTASFLGRITFAWAEPLLNFAARNKGLDIDNLPEVDHVTRSKYLREAFEKQVKTSRRVWKTIAMAHLPTLLLQSVLVTFSCFLTFAPQLALLGILRALEARSQGLWESGRAWIWVFGLGASMFLEALVEGWVFWIVYSKLAIPVQEQLSAVIFAKAMRRKDVSSARKSKQNEGETESQSSPNPESEPTIKKSSGGEDEDEDEDKNLQKTRQSTLNLVAVDAKRVSDFAAFNYVAYATVLELVIAFVFLARLIGWKSLLAGAAASALITPANIYLSGKYTTTQIDQMKFRDQKMAVVTEALQGIRQIKFSALEKQWEQKIRAVRTLELNKQWTVFLYDVGLICIWILNPLLLSAVSLAVYAWLEGGLSASVAFTTMAIFLSIEVTLSILPELISDFLEALVSATRIEEFLNAPERIPITVPSDRISFEDATVAWPADNDENSEDRFALRNLNLAFPDRAFSVISGKTGSGKSLLLASILGECDVLGGTVKVPEPPLLHERFDDTATKGNWIIDSAIAFVAQIPWIENASIKDNILFGLPYDQDRYRKVLVACSLEKDLDMLPDGELTDIGANGINLSGGQKWRISFARALYSRAGILVMDDLFSALDAHTGRHLYEHAITGELCQGRTRILVTHHVSLALPRTDYLVVLEDGGAKMAGSVEDLRPNISEIIDQEHEIEETTEEAILEDAKLSTEDGESLQKILSNKSRRKSSTANRNHEAIKREPPKKFIEEEKRETGAIDLAIYGEYIKKSGGPFFMGLIFLSYGLFMALVLGRSWWLKIWTGSEPQSSVGQKYLVNQTLFTPSVTATESKNDNHLAYYLGIYFAISIVACIVGTLRIYLVLRASIRASRHLFDNLTYAILRAPLRWLDTVPVGRVLNRFTADFLMVDSKLAYDFGFMLWNVFEILGIIVVSILVSPMLILLAVLLLVACLWYSLRYLAGAREIKRLESNAKSPIFEQFGSALTGLTTIRAFGKGDVYVERMYANIDRHAQAAWHLWLFNRWMSYRMNVMGAIFSTITGILVVALPGIDASLAGFALSFSVQYSSTITWALRQYANIEMEMNATERVVEYSNIQIENQEGTPVPAAWPTKGRIEVNDLVVGYAPDLPAVLKGLTFSVESNQRVGVVGRTGAGKSSLTLALFRFLEPREGTIHIDGIDVSSIKLHDLRSRLAIIPQDPVLFSGTVRSNLDPFDEYTDEELNDALERVHLITSEETIRNGTHTPPSSISSSPTRNKNKNIFSSLSSTVSEAGLNLSQGQRQLLCLARAIVSRPKIMVLDEATSAVDMSTDALIQRSIRAEFGGVGGSTLLVIAHRLSTIADFDRILVMDAGRAVEFGPPRELMGIEGGVFKSLVEESGERRVLEDIIFGDDE